MRIVSAGQMAELDRHTIEALGIPGMVLMERAALGCTELIRRARPAGGHAVALVGPGNNGGDGSAIVRQLTERGDWTVEIILAADPDRVAGDARTNLDIARSRGVEVHAVDSEAAGSSLERADVWIDAVLGNGLSSAPRGLPASLIERALATLGERERPFVLAVDIPSGISTDTGVCLSEPIPADVTATMAFPKWGHLLPPAIDALGTLEVVEIGIPDDLTLDNHVYGVLVDQRLASEMAWRTARSDHKGTNGRVLVVAGSETMPGAGALCCRAALRSGAALVTQAAPRSARRITISQSPEVMGMEPGVIVPIVPSEVDVVVFGPGKGRTPQSEEELRSIMASLDGRPLVLDADGLHLLAAEPHMPRTGPLILTPHPGELAALVGGAVPDVLADLPAAAWECAQRYQSVVVAKTAGALVAGKQTHFVPAGDPGMATGGSGDVLAGIIAACAVRLEPETAAVLGAWIHSQAGRAAAASVGSVPLIASDIVDAIRFP